MGSTPVTSPRPGGGQCAARAVCSKWSTPIRSPRLEGGLCTVKRMQCAILLSMGKLLLRRFIGRCFKSHSSDRAVRHLLAASSGFYGKMLFGQHSSKS